MARALQDLGRLDEAIAVAKKMAEVDPDDILAHTSLSVLYQKKGMIPEAEEEATRHAFWDGSNSSKKEACSSGIGSCPIQLILLHQMSKRTIRNLQQVCGTGLNSMGLG